MPLLRLTLIWEMKNAYKYIFENQWNTVFIKFIEIILINLLFIQLFHSIPPAHKFPFPYSNKTFYGRHNSQQHSFINALSTWSWGSHFCCDRYIKKMHINLKALLSNTLISSQTCKIRIEANNEFFFFSALSSLG